jgi:cell division protease FtsH
MYADKETEDYRMFKRYSEKTAQVIDEKIKKYMTECFDRAKKIINANKKLIEKMSVELIEKEYMTKDEFDIMMKEMK